MYLLKPISNEVKAAQLFYKGSSKAKQLVLGALFTSLAVFFQSAGGFLPVIGLFISIFSTAPILFCCIMSIPLGAITYILTSLLLLILQPSELMIFPFTTGLLGMATGVAFSLFKRRLNIIISGAALLTVGVITLLYVFKFPILGPMIPHDFAIATTGFIFLFACFYNWVWVEMSLVCLKRLKVFITLE